MGGTCAELFHSVNRIEMSVSVWYVLQNYLAGGAELASLPIAQGFPEDFPGATSVKSTLCRLLSSRSLTAAFHQKHMEIRGRRLGAKLPHHQGDLTPVVSGMVRHMLHQVRQTGLCCPKRRRRCHDAAPSSGLTTRTVPYVCPSPMSSE